MLESDQELISTVLIYFNLRLGVPTEFPEHHVRTSNIRLEDGRSGR